MVCRATKQTRLDECEGEGLCAAYTAVTSRQIYLPAASASGRGRVDDVIQVAGRQSVEFDPSRRRYIESRVFESLEPAVSLSYSDLALSVWMYSIM